MAPIRNVTYNWNGGEVRPTPKAFEVTLRPGAAWRRLYSLRLTVRTTHSTVSAPVALAMISPGEHPSSM